MPMNGLTFSRQLLKKPLFYVLALAVSLLLCLLFTRFDLRGDFEGIYLLRGDQGSLFVVQDDILLGEYERVLFKVESDTVLKRLRKKELHDLRKPYLEYEWNKRTGHGFIQSFFPDGTKFLFCFGRFVDSEGKVPSGLFVGGGLPYAHYEESEVKMNETGMAFYNGKDWHHLWCNVNESIASAYNPKAISPASWKFLGSKVLFAHDGELILKSSHRVVIEGVPLRIDRFAFYRAENRYFVLVNRITNIGEAPAAYFYVYGDEPWVGEFGTSVGNIGWVKDRPVYFEGAIDPGKYSHAGMWDIGNPYVYGGADPQTYTGLANFIEWRGVKPDLAYFSNKIGTFANEKEKVPLFDKQNRVIFLQWGPRVLRPGQSDLMVLPIGMANNDPKAGFPVKPEVKLDLDDLNFVLNED